MLYHTGMGIAAGTEQQPDGGPFSAKTEAYLPAGASDDAGGGENRTRMNEMKFAGRDYAAIVMMIVFGAIIIIESRML